MSVSVRQYFETELEGQLGWWLTTLTEAGWSYRKIADLLTKMVGWPVSKSTVARWVAEQDAK